MPRGGVRDTGGTFRLRTRMAAAVLRFGRKNGTCYWNDAASRAFIVQSMTMHLRPLVTMALIVLLAPSCGDNDNRAVRNPCDRSPGDAILQKCRQATTVDACAAAGGHWSLGGFGEQFLCFCPTGQAGCPCSDESQCIGLCVAPDASLGECSSVTSGVCQAEVPFFGCVCTVQRNGGSLGLCAD